jgi:transcriptional regulator with XRE-family HTH domain
LEYFGSQLRAKREAHGISLRSVARRLKLSAAYICDVELNRRRATERIREFYDNL